MHDFFDTDDKLHITRTYLGVESSIFWGPNIQHAGVVCLLCVFEPHFGSPKLRNFDFLGSQYTGSYAWLVALCVFFWQLNIRLFCWVIVHAG
jgi:hypothetical protein